LPIKIALSLGKELQRSRKIYDGVSHALHLYPSSYVIIIVVGAMKGAGSGFLSIIDRLNRGIFLPNTNEILHPSLYVKFFFTKNIVYNSKLSTT
jgi:trimeric intracellular cation channel